jgi:Flp pilus assembly protein TadD
MGLLVRHRKYYTPARIWLCITTFSAGGLATSLTLGGATLGAGPPLVLRPGVAHADIIGVGGATAGGGMAASATGGGAAVPGVTPEVPQALPQTYAVLPFQNRSGVEGLAWLRSAAPFLLGERLEYHPGLRPAYGPLVVAADGPAQPDASTIAEYGRRTGARWVWTGWFARPAWRLQLGVALWKVEGARAERVGEEVQVGEFADLSRLTGDAIVRLCRQAGMEPPEAVRPELYRPASNDFYAFTVFGRGLHAMTGIDGVPDLKRATKNLSRSVFIDPKLAEGHRVLGELHRREGNPAKARGRFNYALELRPTYYAAMSAQAALTYDDGKVERARELLESMLAQRPWDIDSRFVLGKILWETGRLELSMSELNRVVAHQPGHLAARRILVMIHASRGSEADLVRELEALVQRDPEDVTTRLDLGAAYASAGRLDEAIKTYESLVKRDPRHVHALKFLGDLHKRGGDLSAAVQFYERALRANDDDPRAYFLLGATYLAMGDTDAARRVYVRAQRFRRYLPAVYNNLGAIAYRAGNYEEALWYLKRAVAKQPGSAQYRYNYALSLSATNEIDEALAQIDAGLALERRHVELNYLRGVVLLKKGDGTGAEKAFEQTLALRPEHREARHNLSLIEELRRRAEQGEVTVEGRR